MFTSWREEAGGRREAGERREGGSVDLFPLFMLPQLEVEGYWSWLYTWKFDRPADREG